MLASLNISVLIEFALHKERRVELIGITCDRMQWIASEPDIESATREILNSIGADVDVDKIQPKVSAQISKLLSREKIEVEPIVHFRIEARDFNALKRLVGDANSSCELVDYEKYIRNRSANLPKGKIKLLQESILPVFHPDPQKKQLSIRVDLESSVWLSSVGICVDGKQVAEKTYGKLLEKGEVEIQLPDIPVREFDAIRKAKKQSLTINVGEKNQIPIDIGNFEVPDFSGGVASLFMDMGSTRSKLVSMTTDVGETPTDSHLAAWIERLDDDELTEDIEAKIDFKNPIPTREFLKHYSLPQIEKSQLDEMSDADLARWLGEAVRRFCVHFSNESSPRAVGEVTWSFPQTKSQQRDFAEIAKLANENAGESMLGTIYVVEEHEALHGRFKGILESLAKSSRSAVNKRKRVQKGNRKRSKAKAKAEHDYEEEMRRHNKKFFKRFRSQPEEPDWTHYKPKEVPTVSEYCKRFSEIKASAKLNEWIALDAGGFTLDVVGRIGSREIGTSYRAGGDDITKHVRRSLADEKGVPLKKIRVGDAERTKRSACERRAQAKSRPVARVCRDKTRQIYGPAICEVVAWAASTIGIGRSGLPLILSGGAMYNDYLRELIEEEVEKSPELHCVLVTSIEISQVIENNDIVLADGAGLRRFFQASRGFSTRLKFDISRDVAAGLVECYLDTTPS